MHANEFKRQQRRQPVDHGAGTGIAGVADDLQRLQIIDVDKAQQMLDVGIGNIDRRGHRFRPAGVGRIVRLGQAADVLKPCVGADRPRVFADEFKPVEIDRVVAGRDHDPAIHVLVEGREIDLLGAAFADVENLHAFARESAGQRLAQFLARMADVAADDDALRLQVVGNRAPDAVTDIGIELVGDATADIVGFETGDFCH